MTLKDHIVDSHMERTNRLIDRMELHTVDPKHCSAPFANSVGILMMHFDCKGDEAVSIATYIAKNWNGKTVHHDDSWHQRMAHAAEVVAKDPSIETRLMFYINLIMSDPKSLASPYANARGLLVNIMGMREEEAYHFIQNKITLVHQKATR